MITHECLRPDCTTLTNNAKFCSRSCSAVVANTTGNRTKFGPDQTLPRCIICQKIVHSNKQSELCSRHLNDKFRAQFLAGTVSGSSKSGDLLTRARRILLEEVNFACETCGWNEVNPLSQLPTVQIDHIDGDPANNWKSNLKVLCPNHHSLTPTYGRLNSNAGRLKYGLPLLNRAIRPQRQLKRKENKKK